MRVKGARVPWAVLVALVAAGAVLALSPVVRRPDAPAGRPAPAEAWPHAQQATFRGTVPDGPAYQPVYFLDARTSVGTAPTPDGRRTRLLVRNGDGSIRTL